MPIVLQKFKFGVRAPGTTNMPLWPWPVSRGLPPTPSAHGPADPFMLSLGHSVPAWTASWVPLSPAQPRELWSWCLSHVLPSWLDPGAAWQSWTVSDPGCHHQTPSWPADWVPHLTLACPITTDWSGNADSGRRRVPVPGPSNPPRSGLREWQ